MKDGVFSLRIPGSEEVHTFQSHAEIFSADRDASPTYRTYLETIKTALQREQEKGRRFGALLIEVRHPR